MELRFLFAGAVVRNVDVLGEMLLSVVPGHVALVGVVLGAMM